MDISPQNAQAIVDSLFIQLNMTFDNLQALQTALPESGDGRPL